MIVYQFNNYELIDAGSSLKFCLIAEGVADVYPRFVGSSEWDIAAGYVVLKEAGGKIIDSNLKKINFNKKVLETLTLLHLVIYSIIKKLFLKILNFQFYKYFSKIAFEEIANS